MLFFATIASFLRGNSNAISEFLAIIAIVAFTGAACYVAFLFLRDTAKKGQESGDSDHPDESDSKSRKHSQPKKTLMEFDDGYGESLEAKKREHKAFYESTVKRALELVHELSAHAMTAYEKVSAAYGVHSFGIEGDNKEKRKKRFKSLCERQWRGFRNEMSYLDFPQIQANLRHVLDTRRILEWMRLNPGEDPFGEGNHSIQIQEIVTLLRGVIKDRVGVLQDDMIEGVSPFTDFFEKKAKEWTYDRIFKLMTKLKEGGGGNGGISAAESGYRESFTFLRSRMEVVARLSDCVCQNNQRINEDSIALSQVVYVATLLSLLADLQDWFDEGIKSDKKLALHESESEKELTPVS